MYNQDPHWLIPTVYMASDRLFYHHITHHIDAGKRDVEASSGKKKALLGPHWIISFISADVCVKKILPTACNAGAQVPARNHIVLLSRN